jgi:hypothetical protein
VLVIPPSRRAFAYRLKLMHRPLIVDLRRIVPRPPSLLLLEVLGHCEGRWMRRREISSAFEGFVPNVSGG